MNLDRALAILGVILGALGSAAGVYVSQQNYNIGLLLASGWVAAALLGFTICTLAFRAVSAMERAHAEALTRLADAQSNALRELGEARVEAEQRCKVLHEEAIAQRAELAEFRNISRALSSVVNGEDKPSLPRPRKRARAPSNQAEQATQE
jgi:hypothetical protein